MTGLRYAVIVVAITVGLVELLRKVLEEFKPPLWITLLLIGFGGVLWALTMIVEPLQRRLLLRQYRAAARSSAANVPYVSLRARKPPSIFIEPLCERVPDPQIAPRDAAEHPRQPSVMNIDQALSESKHIVIEGGPGTGKSTLLNNLSTRQHGRAVPVRISARVLASRRASLPTSIGEAVKAELAQRLRHPLPEDFFAVPPTPRGSWMILVDGLDEIGDPESRERLIQSFNEHSEDRTYRFIVATRPLGDDSRWSVHFKRYRLLPFQAEQIKKWADAWFENRLDARPDEASRFIATLTESRLAEAVQVPLLLTMAALLYEGDRARQLPTRRAALFAAYVAMVVDDEESRRETREALREQWDHRYGAQARQWADTVFNARRDLVEHLALWQQGGGTGALAEEAANNWVQRGSVPGHVDREWLLDQAEALLPRTGLLTQGGGAGTFVHQTFREYLAASAVARTSDPDDDTARKLLGRWRDSAWQEVVLFALGIWTEKGANLTDAIRRIDLTSREGLRFAGAALAEWVRVERTVEDEIIDALLALGDLEVLRTLYRRERVTNGLRSLARDPTRSRYDRALAAEALGERAKTEGEQVVLEDALAILLDISQEPDADPGDVLQPLDAMFRLGAEEATLLLVQLARRGDPYRMAVYYLRRLERSDKILELLADRAVGPGTRMDAVAAVSYTREHAAVPILTDLLRNAEEFGLGPEERTAIEKTLQTLSSNS